MPKLKTKKGVAKRLRLTKNKKIKYSICGKKHLLTGKKTKRLRQLRKQGIVEGINRTKYIKRMLPYG